MSDEFPASIPEFSEEYVDRLTERYGKTVREHVAMDNLRRKHCLCLNCRLMKQCGWASQLYSICREVGIALSVTRCPYWEVKEQRAELECGCGPDKICLQHAGKA